MLKGSLALLASVVLVAATASETTAAQLTEANKDSWLAANPEALVFFDYADCKPCKAVRSSWVKVAPRTTDRKKYPGTIAVVDCDANLALCDSYDIDASEGGVKYFQKGRFVSDYIQSVKTAEVMLFLRKPSKEAAAGPEPEPFFEGEHNVVLPRNGRDFRRAIESGPEKLLVMFYAPWCGHCKNAKPELSAFSNELLADEGVGNAVVAVDCTNLALRESCRGISGYPTFKGYVNGKQVDYWGANDKASFATFYANPKNKPEEAPVTREKFYPDGDDSAVALLTDADWNDYITSNSHVLVMFYAPWCGHCKSAKPAYSAAAATLKAQDNGLSLAAVDCTVDSATCGKFGVKSYPTLKFFLNGKFKKDYEGARDEKGFVSFMEQQLTADEPEPSPAPEPKEPEPPAPSPTPKNDEEEDPFADENNPVWMLSEDSFDEFMRDYPKALVFFFAPWCGHCKKAKPAITKAAAELHAEEGLPNGVIAAIDCTLHNSICQKYDVSGYPTIKYFTSGEVKSTYEWRREKDSFLAFMRNPEGTEPAEKLASFLDDVDDSEHQVYTFGTKFTDFEEFIQDPANPSVLVMFYAPWCGHCKTAKAAVVHAAQVAENSQNGKLAAVDCTTSLGGGICQKYGAEGYPTFVYFQNGKKKEKYQGDRGSGDFVAFLKSKMDNMKPDPRSFYEEPHHAQVLGRYIDVNAVVESSKKVLLFLYSNSMSSRKLKPTIAKLSSAVAFANDQVEESSKRSAVVTVDCKAYKRTCKMYKAVSYPAVWVYEEGKLLGEQQSHSEASLFNLFGLKPDAPLKEYTPPAAEQEVEEAPAESEPEVPVEVEEEGLTEHDEL